MTDNASAINQVHAQITAISSAGTFGKQNRCLRYSPFRVVPIAAGIWLSTVVTGLALIVYYSNSPGDGGATPIGWPADSKIRLDASRPTLVMFAHPRCPCTRASLGELDKLMTRCQGRVGAQVWFIKPADTVGDWTFTDLWRQASAIPGVIVRCDDAGAEASRFHSETSGQTVLYDPDGHLLFQGGITISRGHAGDNAGLSALVNLLERNYSSQVQTLVFGCPLFAPQGQPGDVRCKPLR